MAVTTMRGPFDARVNRIPQGLLVLPRDVFKHVGATFTILNNTDVTIHVTFPGLTMDPAVWDIPPLVSQEYTIINAQPGVYDYQVETAARDERNVSFTLRATAGSDPRIIIDY